MTGWTPRITKVEDQDADRLQYANSLLRARRFEEARAEAERFLSGNGHSVAGRVTLGLALLGLRRVDEALSCLELAVAGDPLQPQPLVAVGYAHLQNKDPERAEHCFRQALNLDPELPGATLGRAQACQLQGRIDEARQHLSDLLARHPDMAIARLLLARLHRKSGDLDATVGEIQAVLAQNPGQAGIAGMLPMLFRLQSRNSKYDDSIRLLEAATRFNPSSAVAWSWLGRARLQAGQTAEAEAAFREAIRLKGHALAASIGLADALIAQDRAAEARTVLDATPKRGPAAPLIETAYGDICTAEHRHDDAARHYCAALMSVPGGRDAIAAAEKDVSGEGASAEALAQRYRAALSRAAELAKGRLSEQDWQAIGRRFANAAWRSGGPAAGAAGAALAPGRPTAAPSAALPS